MEDLEKLVRLFEAERDQEGDRFLCDNPPYISAWNPHFTMSACKDRKDRLHSHMKAWTDRWWNARGYTVNFSKNCDGFNIEPSS